MIMNDDSLADECSGHRIYGDDGLVSDPHNDGTRWPPGLPERIAYTYDMLGPYLEQSRAEFTASIMGSPSPDESAVHWLGITAVWDDYHRKYLRGVRLEVRDERKLIAALQLIAEGRADVARLPVSGDAVAALFTCYLELADELPYLSF